VELPLGVGAEASRGARRAATASGGRRSRKGHGAGTCSRRGFDSRYHSALPSRRVGRRCSVPASGPRAMPCFLGVGRGGGGEQWMRIWTPAACDRRAARRSFCRDPFRNGQHVQELVRFVRSPSSKRNPTAELLPAGMFLLCVLWICASICSVVLAG
jgi:hypothetical protein